MVGRKLYGYGLPVCGSTMLGGSQTCGPDGREMFDTALYYSSNYQLTLRERSMIEFMNEITDKPEWTNKIKDETIVKLWQIQRAQKEKVTTPERALSERMFEFCLKELQDYAELQEESGFVPALAANVIVYKSDTLIPESLNSILRAAAAPLEDIPDEDKDWHPGSDEKVLDLVHPSLFPLLYGRTRILPEGTVPLEQSFKLADRGDIIPVPSRDHVIADSNARYTRYDKRVLQFYSQRFQWLPCQVDFTRDMDWLSVRISSYINNLHPHQHKQLYKAIESVIAEVIPMWNAALSSLDNRDQGPRIDVDEDCWIGPEGNRSPSGSEDSGEAMDRDDEWCRKNRTLKLPEPGKFEHRALEGSDRDPVDLREDFARQGLQVIVKLANIHLTPENPRYNGGSWHIEGQMNEHICASAIYYYDSDNLTESHLSFRETVDSNFLEGKRYGQDDFEHLERLYGIENDGPTTQVLGHVKTRQGRLIAFPNVLQHRVSSFEIEDKSKPGHRKILALFLVDPHTPIPSTAHIYPQRRDWWHDAVIKPRRGAGQPRKLRKTNIDADDYTIDLDEAKALRLELMEERKTYVEDMDDRYNQATFGFCEH